MSYLKYLTAIPIFVSCGIPSNTHIQSNISNDERQQENHLFSGRVLSDKTSNNILFEDESMQNALCANLPAMLPVVVDNVKEGTILGNIPAVKDGVDRFICSDENGNAITRGYFKQSSTVTTSPLNDLSLYCPHGTIPSKLAGLTMCIKLDKQNRKIVSGPFPKEFVNFCRSKGFGIKCEKRFLDFDFIRELLTKGGISKDGRCIKGASWSREHESCYDGESAYGPFTKQQVQECFRYLGGTPCLTLRWHGSFVKDPEIIPIPNPEPEPTPRPVPEPEPQPEPIPKPAPKPPTLSKGERFGKFYDSNYFAVQKKARQFWPNSFACAAFASTALKMAGYNVKQVLVTNEVESQLKRLGWKKITNMRALKGGDVVFTDKQTSNIPGTWSHVYVVQTYFDRNHVVVNDNYGKRTKRNLFGGGKYSISKVAYRAPK